MPEVKGGGIMSVLGIGILIALLIGFAKMFGVLWNLSLVAFQILGKLINDTIKGVSDWLHDKP